MELSNSILSPRLFRQRRQLFIYCCRKVFVLCWLMLGCTFVHAQKLYWTEHSVRIARSDLDGASAENALSPGGLPNGIAFDPIRNYAYWADESNQAIYRAAIDPVGGLMPAILWIDLAPLGVPKGVDIDLVNGYFYWADEGTDQIWRADINQASPGPESVATVTDPFDVALNVSLGKMYYTSNNPSPLLSWADLNGANPGPLVSSGSTLFLGIDVDEGTGLVYFVESAGSITQVNFDGSGVVSTPISVSSPFSLALDAANSKMYWVDGANILRANLDGTLPETIHPTLDAPQFLTIDFSSEAPPRIYWTENVGGGGGDDEIHRVDFNGGDFEIVYSGFSDEISGIAMDPVNEFVYWTDAAQAEVFRGKIGEAGFVNIEKLVDVNPGVPNNLQDLALDVPNTMLYYTHGNSQVGFTNKISAADFSQPFPLTPTELIDLGNEVPYGIALDLTDVPNQIYFTTNEDTGPDIVARLRRMNLSGGPSELLFEITTPDDPDAIYFRDVKMDEINGDVHWSGGAVDAINGFIMRNDISDLIPFFSPDFFTFPGEPRGIDIDPINSEIYWVCRGALNGTNPVMIMKSNLDGSNITLIHKVNIFPSGYPAVPPGSAFLALDLRGLAASCASPPTTAIAIVANICEGNTINLSASLGGSASTGMWTTTGDGGFDNTTSLTPIYTPGPNDILNGAVDFTFTTDDPDGAGPCVAALDVTTVGIDRSATVNAGANQTICAGDVVSLTATMGAFSSNPSWMASGLGTFSASTSLTTTYTPTAGDIAAGTVTFTLTVDGTGNCPQATSQLTVTITQPITAGALTLSSNVGQVVNTDVIAASTINTGDVITVTVPTAPTKGTAVVQPNNTISYTASNGTVGADSYMYRICNQCNLCSDATVSITIINEPPVITVPPAVITVLVGENVTIPFSTFIADPNANIDFNSITIITGPVSNAAATFDSNFDLTLDYSNTTFAGTDQLTIEVCDLLSACTQTTLSIEVDGEITAFNGLSPNGDNRNDYFKIQNLAALEPNNKVTIYNRWGDKVFEMDRYDSNIADRRFEGKQNNGSELPSGVYFYRVEFESNREELTGYLTLKK